MTTMNNAEVIPREETISTCQHEGCGLPLEATVKVYLKDVVLDKDGWIIEYRIAFVDGPVIYTNSDQPLGEAINLDEQEEVEIYCANDHPHNAGGETDA